MSRAEDQHSLRIAKAEAWLRDYACDSSPKQLAALNNNHVFTMVCPKHGSFPWSWVRGKDYQERVPCPGCRLESKVGGAVSSVNDAIRYATNHTRWARQQEELAGIQQELDVLHGKGVIGVGSEDYVNKDAYRYFTCGANSSHPPFASTPRRMLNPRLNRGIPRCPQCAEDASAVPKEFSSVARRPGGYLYRVRDTLTGKCYIGLTTLTPEIRFGGHLTDANKGVRKTKFYEALKARPQDFRLEPIAYYLTTEALKSAEIQAITEEGTRFPSGYNLSRGGELAEGGRRAKSLSVMASRVLEQAGVSGLAEDVGQELRATLMEQLAAGRRSKSLISALKLPHGVEVLLGKVSLLPVGWGGEPQISSKQARRSNSGIAVTVFGRTYPSLVAVCQDFRVDRKKLRAQVKRGIPLETALLFGPLIGAPAATPVPPSREQETQVGGKVYPSFKAMCQAHSIAPSTVRRNLAKGCTLEEAVRHRASRPSPLKDLAQALGVSTSVAARLRSLHGSCEAALANETAETLAARVGSVKGEYVTWDPFHAQCLEHAARSGGLPICAANGASAWLVSTQRKFRHRYRKGEMSPEQRAFVESIPGFVENTFNEAQAAEVAVKAAEALRAVESAAGKLTMRELAKSMGIDRKTLRRRLKNAEKLGVPQQQGAVSPLSAPANGVRVPTVGGAHASHPPVVGVRPSI